MEVRVNIDNNSTVTVDAQTKIRKNNSTMSSHAVNEKTTIFNDNCYGEFSYIDDSSTSTSCEFEEIILDETDDNTAEIRPSFSENVDDHRYDSSAKVAAGGGALVLFGALLVPIPVVPLGVPLVGAGLHVLGTEFEQVKTAETKLLEAIDCVKATVSKKYDKHSCHSSDQWDYDDRSPIEEIRTNSENENEFSEQGKLIQQLMISKQNDCNKNILPIKNDQITSDNKEQFGEQARLIQQAMTRSKSEHSRLLSPATFTTKFFRDYNKKRMKKQQSMVVNNKGINKWVNEATFTTTIKNINSDNMKS